MSDNKRSRIKVFIIDDHPIVRDGVRAYLSGMRSIEVVGEAANDEEAVRRVKRLAPNVIIVDVGLPGLDGGELTRRLRQLTPKTKVVAFSMHCGQEYVVRMARCGVQGYVMKGEPTARLVDAIVRVSQGGLYFPEGMADAVLTPGAAACESGALTPREREVLSLLSEGLANKQVAGQLGISVRTAETHRERLSHKLNILTVAGLTKYAIQHGLTSLKAAA